VFGIRGSQPKQAHVVKEFVQALDRVGIHRVPAMQRLLILFGFM
jgi:hypothetical protein